jgi:RNA polymerase sigma-70 factor (ECF subfamily)
VEPSCDLGRLADEELMRLVADMDPAAFEVVYDRHAQAVYSLCYRIAGSRTLADDTCQEAFLSLWRSGGRYDARLGSVRSWLLSIAHNRAIDQLRRATRHEDREVHDDGDARTLRLPSAARTDVEALRRVEADETARLLDRLPPAQRTVIELSFYSGYSHTEIADMLAVPLGTVKGRMRRGLEQIRIHMTGVAG